MDVKDIVKIKTSCRGADDFLAWHPKKIDLFTVRIAYRLAADIKRQDDGGKVAISQLDGCNPLWNHIWKFHVLQKKKRISTMLYAAAQTLKPYGIPCATYGVCRRSRSCESQGCNLSLHRKSERLHFFELQAFPGGARDDTIANSFIRLYSEIQRVVEVHRTGEIPGQFTIVIDDVSLLEVAAHGSVDDVFDFLHYCVTLASEMNCSLVILIHEDIYASEESMGLLLHLRYIADLVIKAAPLSTGLAADVHGQLSVVNKGMFSEQRPKAQRVWNFHFKVKENGADFFYPGSRH
ncbi:elongator complex protein 6 isoform X1 [Phragmites australis]|uniref:elongator complex protein 6 isoform X1 n=1 Tax=Phragmites australis TaxID=29695 RepID=UPI002D7A2517|nr:elongator complex protein 6 isoform X1 [Phragmites australis]